ncbi:MAG: PAS domain S-box protein [Desulfovibrio sp.]
MTHELISVLRASEDALVEGILAHAQERGYTRLTSSKKEDWRLSIRGLTDALEEALRRGAIREISADDDLQDDPVVAFGLREAGLHRKRGVSLVMFQGLFKLYRRTFLEQLEARTPERDDLLRTLRLFFDRLELAICSFWAAPGTEARLAELQAANRELTNTKNMYLTLLESLAQPIAVVGEESVVHYANSAFARLRKKVEKRGDDEGKEPPQLLPWLRDAFGPRQGTVKSVRIREQALKVGEDFRFFDVSRTRMADASGVFSGTVFMLEDVTTEHNTRLAFERGRREQILMLDAMPLPVVLTRATDSIIEYANERAGLLLSTSREELVGSYAPSYYWDPEDRARMVAILERDGCLLAHEARFKGEGGGVSCLMSAVPTMYRDEPCYLFTLLDITERKRIEEEVAKYSQALQQSPIAVFVTDREGRIEYANKTFEALTGCSGAEVRGKTPAIFQEEGRNAEAFERMWVSLQRGRPWRGELNIHNKTGAEYWVMMHLGPLLDSTQQPTHFIAFMEDVTKRKLSEGVLQERLQFIQTLMDAVPTPIFYKNIEGVYQGCNRAFEEYFGLQRPLLIGKTVADISTDKMALVYHQKDIQLARSGGVQIYESHARRKDGEIRDVIFHKATFRDAKGQPAGIVGNLTDITERKRVERESRENEATLRQALTGIRAGILVIDPDRQVVDDLNERAVELLGGKREDYLLKPGASIGWRDALGESVSQERLLEPQSDTEYRLVSPGHGVLPVALTVLPSTIRGKPRILMILFDLSERKALERSLNLAQKLESVGQLAAGIAHEINTPIQYVSSNLSFLGEAFGRITQELDRNDFAATEAVRGDMEEIPDAIKDAQEGVQRVSTIVKAMRNFSHPDAEAQVPVDINEAIRNTVTIARNEWKYHSEVILDLDETLPEVVCIPGDFNQVVLNVLVNAAHAVADKMGDSGERGEIRVRTTRSGKFAELTISDTGGGIPEGNRDKIFDPFFTTKVVGKGTGQGLAITHAIMERHQGEIDFQSEVGKGTTFTIRFPLEGLSREAANDDARTVR